MPAHRGNGGSFRSRRLHAPDQLGEDLGLRLRIPRREIARHLADLGVADGQLKLAVRGGKRARQPTVVELRGRGPDAADQTDMHDYTSRSAICTAFSAAPLSNWSPEMN